MISSALLERIDRIPAWSGVASSLLAMVGDERRSAADFVKLIKLDAGLTATVLKVANSAAFARRGGVSSLSQAVIGLGGQVVIGIVIGSSAWEVLGADLTGYEAEPGALWSHSLRTAIASREFGLCCKAPLHLDEAFTAGLIHDLGKAILESFIRGSVREMLSHLDANPEEDFGAEERRIAGVDHTEVGMEVGIRWNLPSRLLEAIRFHHLPSLAMRADQPLVYSVHLGDIAAMTLGDGAGADSLAYHFDPGYREFFDVSRAKFEEVLIRVEREYTKARQLIQISKEN